MTEAMRTIVSVAVVAIAFGAVGCARTQLRPSDLERFSRPAFVSRIEENAGPVTEVFRSDTTYKPKLDREKIAVAEADRRLKLKLEKGVSRYEISERMRATTFARLPKTSPWTNTVDQAQVASALQTYLVQEVPADVPDYNLLRPLGADAVLEFVVERYGVRSNQGKAGLFVEGYGRLFLLDGGKLWHRAFKIDQVDAKAATLDPFRAAKDPTLFRDQMALLVDSVAAQFAKDLSPARDEPVPTMERPAPELPGGDVAPVPAERGTRPAPSDELPEPE